MTYLHGGGQRRRLILDPSLLLPSFFGLIHLIFSAFFRATEKEMLLFLSVSHAEEEKRQRKTHAQLSAQLSPPLNMQHDTEDISHCLAN